MRLANFDSSKAVLSLVLLLCQQLKDVRITSSTLTIFFVLTPLPEMNQIVTNAKNKIQKWQHWKTHDNKTYIVQKIMKNMRNLLTIFFVLTPLPEMKKNVINAKKKLQKWQRWKTHDNKTWIVQKIVQNMRNLLWCCRTPTPVAWKDSQQTPGDREPGEVLKSCNLEQSSSSFSSCALSSNMTSPLTR